MSDGLCCLYVTQLPGSVKNLISQSVRWNEQNEPAHYNKTCVTIKLVPPPSMARVLLNPSLDSLEAVDSTYDQQRL